jgi:hypothetical protein
MATEAQRKALDMARRVLDHLETQVAGYTALTLPAHLQIELEEQRAKVAEMEAALGEAQPKAQPTSPDMVSGNYSMSVGPIEGGVITIDTSSSRTGTGSGTTPPVQVSVTRLADQLPTAYCQAADAKTFPFLTVDLDNSALGTVETRLRITAVVQDYSDKDVHTVTLAAGAKRKVTLLPLFKQEVLAGLNDIRPASLSVTVEQLAPSAAILYDEAGRVDLLATNMALLGAEQEDGSVTDFTPYLAAWVTPYRLEIEQLLRKAAAYHPNQQFVGYQGANSAQAGAAVVREQVKAIFSALKNEVSLTYIHSALNLELEGGRILQRVRLPRECLAAGGSANCLDGTVLFASLLLLATIEPQLVLIPSHAFVGWRVFPETDEFEFLDTTLIGSAEFDEAMQTAQTYYQQVTNGGFFERPLYNPNGFARRIDVLECRKQGIQALE